MNKYVIKNCPAYSTFYPDTGAEPFTACDAGLPLKKCQDCTDCVMKKIVEKCREDEKPIILDVHEEAKDGMIVGRMLLKKEILNMLDIEECE